MWRKRSIAAPGFRIPQPFNPITGKFARLGNPPVKFAVYYGLAQSDWNGARPNIPTVSVKLCKADGSDPTGSAFDCYLPRIGDMDPQVYAQDSGTPSYPGDTVPFVYDDLGNAVAIGSYLGPRVGTITLWTSATVLPYGWCLCNGDHGSPDLRTRFVMGVDPADSDGLADENAIAKTGGYRWHGKTENNHFPHPSHWHLLNPFTGAPVGGYIWPGGGGGMYTDPAIKVGNAATTADDWDHLGPFHPAEGVGQDTDNRPPYYALAYIYRFK